MADVSRYPKLELINIRDGFFARTEASTLDSCLGKISATQLRPYPPGIPIINYGQRINASDLTLIKELLAQGKSLGAGLTKLSDSIDICIEPDEPGPCVIRQVNPADLSEKEIWQISEFFREIFSNPPYIQFALHKDEPGRPLSFDDLIKSTGQEKIPYRRLAELDAVHLPNGYFHFMNPEKCHQVLSDRFQDPGYLTILEDLRDGTIQGILHGRVATIERLFHTEEWFDPWLFAEDANFGPKADENNFFKKMNFHLGLSPQSRAFTISAQAIHPDYRAKYNYFFKMMESMANAISAEHNNLSFLAESNPEAPAHILNSATNDRVIFGLLENGHSLIVSNRLSNALWHYQGGRGRLFQSLKNAAHFNRKPYHPDDDDNPKVLVKTLPDKGLGVFAISRIAAGETIARFRGELYRADKASLVPDIMKDHCLQIGHSLYIHAHKKLAELVNHACDPNCGIRDYTQIFAVRDIETGEEITWDYRCTENSDWVMEGCLCGSPSCSGIVKGFDSLPPEKKVKYLKKGMVSEWICQGFQSVFVE